MIKENSVRAEALPVLDEGFFNEKRFIEWYNMLLDFAVYTINLLREETGNVKGIAYEVNSVLLREVIYDAMIDLKKIVVSENNEVKEPNAFKIAAHLGYWFLRHKPIVFRAESNICVDEMNFANITDETQRKSVIVEMKHLNEVAVARFLLRYIFVVESSKPICSKRRFAEVKKSGCMFFDSYPDMLIAIFEKLKYHLTYREISPKIIEHFLEAYTLHPYVPYTCDLWNNEEPKQ